MCIPHLYSYQMMSRYIDDFTDFHTRLSSEWGSSCMIYSVAAFSFGPFISFFACVLTFICFCIPQCVTTDFLARQDSRVACCIHPMKRKWHDKVFIGAYHLPPPFSLAIASVLFPFPVNIVPAPLFPLFNNGTVGLFRIFWHLDRFNCCLRSLEHQQSNLLPSASLTIHTTKSFSIPLHVFTHHFAPTPYLLCVSGLSACHVQGWTPEHRKQ